MMWIKKNNQRFHGTFHVGQLVKKNLMGNRGCIGIIISYLKDPLQIINGTITRAWAKRFKVVLHGLIMTTQNWTQ